MGELKQFKLPDVGEGLTEADIIKWHVQPGDAVEVNQTILEIETAKAVVELPCPFEGTVTELLVEEGTTVDVGVPIITVDIGGEAAPADVAENTVATPPPTGAQEPGMAGSIAPKVDPTAPQQQKRVPVLVGYGVKPGSTTRRPRRAPSAEPSAPVAPVAPSPNGGGARVTVLAKPPVRKLAKDLGVDLTRLVGTGPQGSISREDVQSAVAAPAEQPAPVRAAGERERRIPVKGVRKLTAENMVASAFTAPHVSVFLTVDVTRTMQALDRLRAHRDWRDVRVSPLLLVAKAAMVALRRHPMVNSTWAGEEIILKGYVNLGIAAATERGLIVPNIKDADAMSLRELADAMTALVQTAKAGRTPPADMAGGTFTITNVGVYGVDAGTPILPPGEAAILCLGAVREQPWVHEGQIAVRQVTTLGMSFDHRIIDGELGSKFLSDVGAFLTDPEAALLAWG